MKKSFLLAIVMLFGIAMQGHSAPVTKERALNLARLALRQVSLRMGQTAVSDKISIDYVYRQGDAERGITSQEEGSPAYFYVANRGNNEGYALVAADDRIPTILAYSPIGRFDMDSMPDNLRMWLQIYDQEIGLILSGKARLNEEILRTEGVPAEVHALMDNGLFANDPMRWNQGYPWNNKEPLLPNGNHAYTGCVATAAAQIMRYHSWPLQGEGSFDYHAGSLVGNWSGTFGEMYDWSNMPGNPDLDNLTQSQVDAYATLMRDVSASVSMSFYENGSGTYSVYVVEALRNNFRYKRSLQLHVRALYTSQEWHDMIRGELASGRPVYYAGNNQSIGHAFVCDGYASDGTFHFNWGWGGVSNGFYKLTLLSPTSLGIGGEGIGFTIYQEIITGIEPAKTPAEAGTDALPILALKDIEAEYKSESGLNVEYSIYNTGEEQSNLDLGYRLNKADGEVIEVKTSSNNISWYGYGEHPESFSLAPNQLSQGINTITLLYRRTGTEQWEPVRHAQGGYVNSIKVNTTDPNNIVVTVDNNEGKLSIVPNSFVADLNSYEHSTITVQFNSDSPDEIRTPVAFALSTGATANDVISLGWVMAEVPGGSSNYPVVWSKDVLTLSEGDYTLWYRFSINNQKDEWKKIGSVSVKTPIEYTHPLFEVGHNQTSTYTLDMAHNRVLPDFTLKNLGLPFNGELVVVFRQTQSSSGSLWAAQETVHIKQGETFVYKPVVEGSIPDGSYRATLHAFVNGQPQLYLKGKRNYTVKIVNGTAVEAIESSEEIRVFPNPARDYVEISAPCIPQETSIILFDLSGKIVMKNSLSAGHGRMDVSRLPNGAYILKVDGYTTKINIVH
ncbi:thiol protease/hemagglutinin PrtT [Porphyromonas gingivalis]|uniref:thiol protease/hemagglutinin PrtT n=1 Tax=Porphyromonas gingivalis TaxID=837 RepID=UPI001F34D676|nr:thiol protease/hemagglutinin PrtT [Porphyromonas gingivalis]MCE8193128.1 thiol protease/hemagglutinin PrtT [Porphyromonas gingivalis]